MNEEALQEYQRKGEAKKMALRCSLFRLLAEKGIDRVAVDYSGYGDSGQIDTITCDSKGKTVDTPDDLDELISDFVYDSLPGGWEINDGSQGYVEIDVAAQKATVNHEWHETTTTSEAFEI